MAFDQDQRRIAAVETLRLGLEARRRGDRLAALAHFRAAVDADRTGIRPRVELAREAAELGQVREAVEILAAVLKEVPDQPQARALLCYLGDTANSAPGREAGPEISCRRWLPPGASCHRVFLGGIPV